MMNKENHWSVYAHINKNNGKIYFGITGIDPKKRWSKGYKHCTKFEHAINKYGWDGFVHEVIYCDISKEQAQQLQKQFIKCFMTQDDMYGYNIADGGCVNLMGEETRKKVSNAQKGHGDYGGGNPKKPVFCIQTGQHFASCSSAARWCGSNSSHIAQCCKGILKSVKGYHWRYVFDNVALTTIESVA